MVGELLIGLYGGGAAIAVLSAVRSSAPLERAHRELLAALAADGPMVARAVLERHLPPLRYIMPVTMAKQRARMASLAVLGDVDELEAELATHHGRFPSVAQVNAIALIGIAVRTTGSAQQHAINRLDVLGAVVAREVGAVYWLLRAELRGLVALGHGLLGSPIAARDMPPLAKLARNGTVGLLITQALVAGFEASGLPAQAENCRRRVRAATTAFEPR